MILPNENPGKINSGLFFQNQASHEIEHDEHVTQWDDY